MKIYPNSDVNTLSKKDNPIYQQIKKMAPSYSNEEVELVIEHGITMVDELGRELTLKQIIQNLKDEN